MHILFCSMSEVKDETKLVDFLYFAGFLLFSCVVFYLEELQKE